MNVLHSAVQVEVNEAYSGRYRVLSEYRVALSCQTDLLPDRLAKDSALLEMHG